MDLSIKCIPNNRFGNKEQVRCPAPSSNAKYCLYNIAFYPLNFYDVPLCQINVFYPIELH
ncbi:hypothetical protein BpHYR1_044173 [Brachionus plicatilis]|uniref:Uncharacterized protein n=1 Tax=Brachionus plicatilis TaxID=10195 RepID=A0A3M7QGC3_BRAPC|nr:hypothetical protein BpHYR1_044173 [Brachionus plicatilis]